MQHQMFVFFIIVFIVYLAVNYFIYSRGKRALPGSKKIKITYTALFFFFVLAYPLGRVIELTGNFTWARIFIVPGAFWLAAVLYFFLFILLIDFIRALNNLFKFFPKFIKENWAKTKLYTLVTVVVLTAFIIFVGYVNANEPVVKNVHIKVHKKVKNMKTLRIALVTDIHIGMLHGKKFVDGLVKSLKQLHPDIILLAGDILDEDAEVVIREKSAEHFSILHPKYGIWGVTGNHEYYGGVEKAVKYLRKTGIRFLRDNYVNIDGKFYLIGREDLSKNRMTGKKRKSLTEIMKGVNTSEPVILMDHQPVNLAEAEKAKVDLQVSGHTHRGQLWPLNIITNAIYELAYGSAQKGDTHYYVSSGYGTWGPPVRIANKPEIVVITITFN